MEPRDAPAERKPEGVRAQVRSGDRRFMDHVMDHLVGRGKAGARRAPRIAVSFLVLAVLVLPTLPTRQVFAMAGHVSAVRPPLTHLPLTRQLLHRPLTRRPLIHRAPVRQLNHSYRMDGTYQVPVTISALSPALPRPQDTVTVSGALVNAANHQIAGARLDMGVDDRHDAVGVVDQMAPLPPGARLPFTMRVPVSELGLGGAGDHSLRVTLTGREGGQLGSARVRLPWSPPDAGGTPLGVAVLWPVTDVPHMEAVSLGQGDSARPVFRDDVLTKEFGRTGRLRQVVDVGGRLPVTWMVDPGLLDEAKGMAGGYRVADTADVGDPRLSREGDGAEEASGWLTAIRGAVKSHAVVALPYADPDLSALAHSGSKNVAFPGSTGAFGGVLRQSVRWGAATARNVLGVPVRTDVAWPYGGALDAGIERLAEVLGSTTYLSSGNGLSTGASASRVSLDGRTTALVGDREISAVLSRRMASTGDTLAVRQELLGALLRAHRNAQRNMDGARLIVVPPRQMSGRTAHLLADALQSARSAGWVKLVGLDETGAGTGDSLAARVGRSGGAVVTDTLAGGTGKAGGPGGEPGLAGDNRKAGLHRTAKTARRLRKGLPPSPPRRLRWGYGRPSPQKRVRAVERPAGQSATGGTGRPGRADRTGGTGRAGRPGRVAPTARSAGSDRTVRPGGAQYTDRTARAGGSDRPGRPDRPGRADRTARAAGSDRTARESYPQGLRAGEPSADDLFAVTAIQPDLGTLSQVLSDPARTTDAVHRAMLRAVSTGWRVEGAGGDAHERRSYTQGVRAYVDHSITSVHLLPNLGTVTMAGDSASIPITIANGLQQSLTGLVLRVTSSAHNRVSVGDPSTPVRAPAAANHTERVKVDAHANGPVQITAQLYTVGNGHPWGDPVTFRVRVSNISRLVVGVISAGVLLVLLAGSVKVRRTRLGNIRPDGG